MSTAAFGQGTDELPALPHAPADGAALLVPLSFSAGWQDSTAGSSLTPTPPFSTLLPALSRVAGVQATPYSRAPGAWATVRIRGAANLSGNAQPLYVVDGVPVYNTDVTPERWPRPLTTSSLAPAAEVGRSPCGCATQPGEACSRCASATMCSTRRSTP